MPLEEFLSKKDHTSSLETHSPFTPSTYSVPSLPFTPSIGSRTRPQFSTESPTPPSGQPSGHAPVLPLTSHVFSLIHSTTQLEKSWTCGPRRMELTFSKETIEKQLHGCGSEPQLGILPSQDS